MYKVPNGVAVAEAYRTNSLNVMRAGPVPSAHPKRFRVTRAKRTLHRRV